MVNLDSEHVVLAFVKILHILAGVYIWEFLTTLDYEWRVFRGHLPRRPTIWIYSVSRVACLVGVILLVVGMDISTPFNCQIWVSFASVIMGLSVAGSSLLIVLRIIAIWNRNTTVMVTAISLWAIGIVFHIQAIARFRSAWDPVHLSCFSVPTKKGVINLTPTIFADVALLPILLVGLVILRCRGGGTIGLSSLFWRQGVIWLLIVFVCRVPLIVIAVSSSNDAFLNILMPSNMVAITIATTRMHRSLIEASRTPYVHFSVENVELASGVAFSKSIQTASISPPNRTVHKVFEQHPTALTDGRGSCESTNEQLHEEPILSSLGDDV